MVSQNKFACSQQHRSVRGDVWFQEYDVSFLRVRDHRGLHRHRVLARAQNCYSKYGSKSSSYCCNRIIQGLLWCSFETSDICELTWAAEKSISKKPHWVHRSTAAVLRTSQHCQAEIMLLLNFREISVLVEVIPNPSTLYLIYMNALTKTISKLATNLIGASYRLICFVLIISTQYNYTLIIILKWQCFAAQQFFKCAPNFQLFGIWEVIVGFI